MRVGNIPFYKYKDATKEQREALRYICGLPPNASISFLEGPRSSACLGFPSLTDLKAAFVVAQACRTLNPEDEVVGPIARDSLLNATTCPTIESTMRYIQNPLDHIKGRSSNKFVTRCHWSYLNLAIRHLNLTIVLELRTGDNELECWVAAPGAQLQKAPPNGISQAIRAALGSAHTVRLLSMSQGRAFFLLSLSPASSHFFRTGYNTNFSEWYFIMKARLDLLFVVPDTSTPTCQPAAIDASFRLKRSSTS